MLWLASLVGPGVSLSQSDSASKPNAAGVLSRTTPGASVRTHKIGLCSGIALAQRPGPMLWGVRPTPFPVECCGLALLSFALGCDTRLVFIPRHGAFSFFLSLAEPAHPSRGGSK